MLDWEVASPALDPSMVSQSQSSYNFLSLSWYHVCVFWNSQSWRATNRSNQLRNQEQPFWIRIHLGQLGSESAPCPLGFDKTQRLRKAIHVIKSTSSMFIVSNKYKKCWDIRKVSMLSMAMWTAWWKFGTGKLEPNPCWGCRTFCKWTQRNAAWYSEGLAGPVHDEQVHGLKRISPYY